MGYFATTEHLPTQRRDRMCDALCLLERMSATGKADSQRRSLIFMLESTELASMGDRDAVAFSTRELREATMALRAHVMSNRDKIAIDDLIALLPNNARGLN